MTRKEEDLHSALIICSKFYVSFALNWHHSQSGFFSWWRQSKSLLPKGLNFIGGVCFKIWTN